MTIVSPAQKNPKLTSALLCDVLKKVRTNTASHATQFVIALGNHALRAKLTD